MIKTKTQKMIDVSDWDDLVKNTYGKPYNFQQQYGCQERGNYYITVPSPDEEEFQFENDTLEEKVNGDEMGVSFKAWLARDPSEWNGAPEDSDQHGIELWWERNFYPSIEVVANDLHSKGLLPAGEYVIEIDW